jgi:hypothetical protein
MIPRGDEYIKVYAQGLYGTTIDGKPVYPYYKDEFHSAENLPLIEYEPLIIGCDYGIVSPAVIIAQFIKGQIRFLKEFVGEYETITNLWKNCVMPFFNKYCKGFSLEVIGDPADTAQGREQLQALGIEAKIASTNKIEARITAMTNALNEMALGASRVLISRKGCPLLREGFLGEYHYRRLRVIGEEKYVDVPNKVHPYSDVHDAAQYVVLKILGEEGIFDRYHDYPFPKRKATDNDRSIITGY